MKRILSKNGVLLCLLLLAVALLHALDLKKKHDESKNVVNNSYQKGLVKN